MQDNNKKKNAGKSSGKSGVKKLETNNSKKTLREDTKSSNRGKDSKTTVATVNLFWILHWYKYINS